MKRLAILTVMLLCVSPRPGRSAISGGTVIQTVAGHGGVAGTGGDGGPAADAYLTFVYDAAVDAAGNVFIADGNANQIRRIDAATGIITTFAGHGRCTPTVGDGGPATAASLCQPWGIAVAPNGDVIVADAFHRVIRRISAASGIISSVAGNGTSDYTGDNGPATAAGIAIPTGLAVDATGNIYFAVTAYNRIRRVDAVTGIITTVAGTGTAGFSGDGGQATLAPLNNPTDVAVDDAGTLFVNDHENCRIRRVDPVLGTISTVAGNGTCETDASPGLLAGDRGPATAATLAYPTAIVFDSTGNLYIADGHHERIRRVDAASGIITTVAGNGERGFSGDNGPATSATLGWPQGLGIDRFGNLYIADTFNHVVRKVPVDDVPMAGDIDGDGAADLIVWRPETATWYWLSSSTGYAYAAARSKQWGSAALGDVPMLADLDGDRKADLIVWRASTGTWYWLTSSSGYSYAAAGARQWGAKGDTPLIADVDGDHRDDLVVWRPAGGTWFWLTSSTGYSYAASEARQWGNLSLGDVPLTGDLDGDGRTELIVWRGSTGDFQWLASAAGYAVAHLRAWGNRPFGDAPTIADMDGDRRGDLVVWRASTGTWFWLTAATAWTDVSANHVQWGNRSYADAPLLADFDKDQRADLAVWRASSGVWYWILSAAGFSPASVQVKPWGS